MPITDEEHEAEAARAEQDRTSLDTAIWELAVKEVCQHTEKKNTTTMQGLALRVNHHPLLLWLIHLFSTFTSSIQRKKRSSAGRCSANSTSLGGYDD